MELSDHEWESVLEAGPTTVPSHDLDAAYARMMQGGDTSAGQTRGISPQTPRQRRGIPLVAGAAFVMAMLLWLGGRIPPFNHSQVPGRTYTTHVGQRADIVLDDGSHVTLASNSRLSVAPNFGVAQRAISLRGEAYFQVTAQHGTPFVIRTGKVTTCVLGTAFDVRYVHPSVVQIAVSAGKIMAIGPRSSVTVTAGMVARVTDSTVSADAVADIGSYSTWTRGRLELRGVLVPAMLAELGRWYGYEFRLTDSSLAQQRVTAVFDIAKRHETLTALTQLLDVTLSFNGSTVTLHPHTDTALPRSTGTKTWPTHSEEGR